MYKPDVCCYCKKCKKNLRREPRLYLVTNDVYLLTAGMQVSYDEARILMSSEPDTFKQLVTDRSMRSSTCDVSPPRGDTISTRTYQQTVYTVRSVLMIRYRRVYVNGSKQCLWIRVRKLTVRSPQTSVATLLLKPGGLGSPTGSASY